KFGGSPIAVPAAPDLDEKKTGHQAHLVKQEPEDEILGGEGAVKSGLHDEQKCARAAAQSLREQGEREDERGKNNEKQAQAIDADEVLGAGGWNPIVPFDELQGSNRAIEVAP